MPSIPQELVSIGLPVYNGERYLATALECLLSQTWNNLEVVISDNASTDRTQDICQATAAADSRVRYVRQGANLGAMGNFQFVLEEAKGQYFMWAACDDCWDADWIDELMHSLTSRADAIAAYGRLQHIDPSGMPMKHPANAATFPYDGGVLARRLKYFLQFEGNGKANPIYAIFRREALRGLMLRDYPYDYLIVFDLLRKGPFLSVPQVALYKRIHATSEGAAVLFGAGLAAVLQQLAQPVPMTLLKGYLYRANCLEQAAMLLTMPLKLILALAFRGSRFMRARMDG